MQVFSLMHQNVNFTLKNSSSECWLCFLLFFVVDTKIIFVHNFKVFLREENSYFWLLLSVSLIKQFPTEI